MRKHTIALGLMAIAGTLSSAPHSRAQPPVRKPAQASPAPKPTQAQNALPASSGSYLSQSGEYPNANGSYSNAVGGYPVFGALPGPVQGFNAFPATSWSGPSMLGGNVLNPSANAAELEEAAKFQKAIGQLRAAETEADKKEARGLVNTMIGEQLDRDLEQREKALTDIEARVKEMRSQLEERKQSKAEIQKMIMLMIEQPQVGLGLPRTWMNAIQPEPPNDIGPTIYAPSLNSGTYSPGTNLNTSPVLPAADSGLNAGKVEKQ